MFLNELITYALAIHFTPLLKVVDVTAFADAPPTAAMILCIQAVSRSSLILQHLLECVFRFNEPSSSMSPVNLFALQELQVSSRKLTGSPECKPNLQVRRWPRMRIDGPAASTTSNWRYEKRLGIIFSSCGKTVLANRSGRRLMS